MKLTTILTRVAALGVAASVLGLVFNAAALATLAFALGASVALIAATDYAPRTSIIRPLPAGTRTMELHRLAA